MANVMNSESSRLYSWWWDSHNSPKNSKWLQENLTDMDSKVKAMIKLIEEDADSFARRAEMYYKKRPELMKLVEEFYRAYRALAERYNHATRDLRQAHRTMAQAFPDQVPFSLSDEAASGSESDNPETPHPIRSLLNRDFQGSKKNLAFTDVPNENGRKGLKQLNDMFQSAADMSDELISEADNTNTVKNSNQEGSNRASEDETELLTLEQMLAKFEAERDAIFIQYQEALGRLSILVKDLSNAKKDLKSLSEITSDAKIEIQQLHESLKRLETERDACLLQYTQSLESIAALERLVNEAQEDSQELREGLAKAELESRSFKQELARLEHEKKASELLYTQCLEKLADLEIKNADSEERFKTLVVQSEKTETEVKTLKEEIGVLNLERDTMAIRYEETLGIVSELHKKLSEAQEENTQLNSKVLLGLAKLKDSEDERVPLVKLNECLLMEAQTLAQKIAAADEEISDKQAEIEKLMLDLEEEHSRFMQAEAKLHTLQNMHSQSQQDQKALTLELENVLKTIKDLEVCKGDLQEEIQRLKNNNNALNEANFSSSISHKYLISEISSLKEVKEKLEGEVLLQTDQSASLGVQVLDLQEEIKDSNIRYQALVQKFESVGLDPEGFVSSFKGLEDENLRLKEISLKSSADQEALLRRLEDREELLRKIKVLESSLSEMNVELQRSKEKSNTLEGFYNGLAEDKSALVAEKSVLLSQLQLITETMQSLLEKNMSLQTSLCSANSELEGLRASSKGLEEFCQLLNSEKSNLLAEKSSLVSRLEMVEQKIEKLEVRFTNLEDKYYGIEKEKHSTLSKVDELRITLDVEKQERACLALSSEARFSGLEVCINDLREENKCRKNEFEEQLQKAVNAQVEIFVLQSFVQDMEDKNYALLVECQRHAERAQYSEKLITELECENMIQQVEAEFLLGNIDTFRAGINQVLKALKIKCGTQTEFELNILPCVIASIEDIQQSLSESKDENHQLLMEKSVLSTLLAQLRIDCGELASRKASLEQETIKFTQKLLLVENEKHKLLDTSRQLNLEISVREKRESALEAEVVNLISTKKQLCEENFVLQEENLNTFEKNRSLEVELSCIKGEKNTLVEENSVLLFDVLALSYQSMIFKSYGIEKVSEMNEIVDDMACLDKAYKELGDVAQGLKDRLMVKEVENLALKASMEKLEEKQHELSCCNDQLTLEISNNHVLLSQKEKDLVRVESKLKVTQDENAELCSTIICLENDQENLKHTRIILEKQVVELSEHNNSQKNELVHLREENENLESEVCKLHESIEECKIREVVLTSELRERSSEFELWEAEAASFYFDLQISSVREVLYENKVHDLGTLCEDLEEVTNRRSVEIDEMKERVASLENDAEALKSQLTTCLPLIASLQNNVAEIERNPLLQSKLQSITTRAEQENHDLAESSTHSHSLTELQKLHARIKVIENILNKEKETAIIQENEFAKIRLEAAFREINDLKTQINKNNHEERQYTPRDSTCKTSESKIREEVKDIPLDQASGLSFRGPSQRGSAESNDQMLELWEAAEQDGKDGQLISDVLEHGTDTVDDEIGYASSGDPDQTGYDPVPESHFAKELGVDHHSKRKGNRTYARERLASDAQTLMTLQVSVQELMRKVGDNKKNKKAEDLEYKTFTNNLNDLQSSLVQLIEMNTKLMKTTEESSRSSDIRVEEQAREEAEKIERLELELQRIQCGLLRLMDEENSKSNATILVREFFNQRGWKSKNSKKTRFCGCFTSSKKLSDG